MKNRFFVDSFGAKFYFYVLSRVKLMIGNSSSGIIESSSFLLPVVDIGRRQEGRFKPSNVFSADLSVESIRNAIMLAQGVSRKDIINPYKLDGKSSGLIVESITKFLND